MTANVNGGYILKFFAEGEANGKGEKKSGSYPRTKGGKIWM